MRTRYAFTQGEGGKPAFLLLLMPEIPENAKATG